MHTFLNNLGMCHIYLFVILKTVEKSPTLTQNKNS